MSWDPVTEEEVFQDFVEGNRSSSCSQRHLWINIIALRDEAVVYLEVASTRFAAYKLIAATQVVLTLNLILSFN
jgi:hypothetical protein